uniref:Metalloendopeptidase n=1 Tax=Parastrongyloides trichosuri TaxID=131310 RepID=A0A0N4Z572_PARTI
MCGKKNNFSVFPMNFLSQVLYIFLAVSDIFCYYKNFYQNVNIIYSNETLIISYNKKYDKRAIQGGWHLRWSNPIKYMVLFGVNNVGVSKALSFFSQQTCLRFKNVQNLRGSSGIIYKRANICASQVGRQSMSHPQDILITNHCNDNAGIQHETLHALGLEHEMARMDRDNYIILNKHNMQPGSNDDYRKEPGTINYNLRYDFGSLMHYDRHVYTKNNELTTVTRNKHYLKTIGQSRRASFYDIKVINLHYCNHICKIKLKCYHQGYTDPNDCSKCKCPSFYGGRNCEQLLPSDGSCPEQKYKASNVYQTLYVHGAKKCFFQLEADSGYKIKLILVRSVLPYSRVCQPNIGLETKFLQDKGVSGARFCGNDNNEVIISGGRFVTIGYFSGNQNNYFELKYKVTKG